MHVVVYGALLEVVLVAPFVLPSAPAHPGQV